VKATERRISSAGDALQDWLWRLASFDRTLEGAGCNDDISFCTIGFTVLGAGPARTSFGNVTVVDPSSTLRFFSTGH
jgi:hypothetical protein